MRFKRNIHLLASLLLASMQAWANGLPQGLSQALNKAGIPLEAVSIQVQSVEGGSPLLSLNATQPMNPASTMKLVTTYAALKSLGPSYTWKTVLWTTGELNDGKLKGDLHIRGGGDPYLTLERMWLLQRALREKGVREIVGNVVLDLSLYDLPPMDPGLFDGEPFASYNAIPSPLIANFNVQNLRLKPNGDVVEIRPEVKLDGVRLTSKIALSDGPCNGWRDGIRPGIPDLAVLEIVFEGTYPRACGEKEISFSLFSPPFNFVQVFRALWEESGGKWQGVAVFGQAPTDIPPLLEFESPPLADVVRPLNKYSSNVMTRMLFLTLGQERFGKPATLGKSVMAVREILREDNLDFTELFLENGAGLSRDERINAHSMSQVLLKAYKSPHFSELESAFPIVATDGTLKKRFNGSALTGHAHLKTGSLKDVRALAGYVNDRNGRRLALVMFINHENAGKSEAAQGELLQWVYEGALPE